MAAKITEKEYKRILQLLDLGLTHDVIAQRMGITQRTVRIYVRAAREGTKPYHPDEKLDVQPDNNG